MNEREIDEAAKFLAAARLSGRPGARLPEACRPADIESALAIQRRVVALMGQAIGGWKCSLPSGSGTDQRRADLRADDSSRRRPARWSATGAVARIEPEVAFVMARDLPQRDAPYSEAEVRAPIAKRGWCWSSSARAMPSRAQSSWPEMMADCVQNQGLFVGPALPQGPDAPLEAFP